ncbi:MAG: hypothetical protein ACE5GS_14100 [Kiloniellaceae bacterium]
MLDRKLGLPLKGAAVALALAMLMSAGTARAGGGNELRLRAALSGGPGDISGTADFRDRGDRRRFSAEIQGFTPGQMFDVSVANTVVGKVVVDQFGIGDINFDSNFEAGVDDPATQFPGNFPMLDGGESVVVGPLSGTLQVD